MKITVLAIALLCASVLDARFILWPPGKEFVYDYYAHFLSTIEDVGNRAVGIAITAKISISSESEQSIFVKLDEFKTASLNENVDDIDEDALPWKFQVSPGQLTQFVQMPFRAKLVQGRLEQFEVSREEPFESINIKKAILDMIQVDHSKFLSPAAFGKSDAMYYSGDVTMRYSDTERSRKTNTLTSADEDVNIIRYMEDGVIGKCESSYIVTSEPSPWNPDAEVMNITKFRTYNNCEKKPEWIRTTHVPVQCADCEAHELHPYPTVHRVDIDIRRQGAELIIESIESEAQTQFKPFTANSDYLLSNHSQILTLIRVKPIKTSLPQLSNPTVINHLQYVFPTAHRALKSGGYSLKKPLVPFLNDKKMDAVQEATTSFEKTLSLIVDETTKSQHDDTLTLEMYNCVRAIRLMTYEDLHKFYSNVGLGKNSRDTGLIADDRTQLFSQLLAMTGSAPSVLFIKYMVESQILTGELAVQVVQSIPTNLYEVPYELLNEILSLAKNRIVQENSQLRKTAWLSFGILLHKACDGPEDDIPNLPTPPHIRVFCPEEVERKFLQEIDQELRQTDKMDEEILFMKVLGLTQLPGAIEYLRPYASGEQSEHESIQVEALRNLREIAIFSPEPVSDIAEEEFFDTDNPYVVRLAALRAFLAAQPDYSDLQRIVAWADKEPSDDISGYIVSFFQSMSNASHYCLLDLANNAEQLLSFLDEEDLNGIQGSNVFETSQMFDDLGVSTQSYISWTKSNSSVVPETICVRTNLTAAGYSVKPFQMQLHTKGLQTIIDRLLGPKGSFRKINSLEDLFRPEAEDEDKKRTDINEKLDLDSREEDPFMFNAFVKLGDTQARMFYADYKSIIEYIRSSRFDFTRIREGIPLHFHKLALMFEIQHQFPSILGMPIILNIFNPTVVSFKGKVSASIETSRSYVPDKIRFELSLKPSFQSTLAMRLGVYNPFEKELSVVGVKSDVYLNMPMVAKAEFNLLDSKLNFQLKPSVSASSSDKVSLVDLKVKPYSCQYKLTTMNDNCQRPKIIHQDPEPDVNDVDLSESYLGLPFLIKSTSEHDWNDLASFITDFQEYEDIVTFFSTLWTLPEFASRHHQLLLNERKAKDQSVDVTAAFEYKPTPSERKVLESRHSAQGIFTVLSGFATLPQRCGSKGAVDSRSDSENWYLEQDSSARSYPSSQRKPYKPSSQYQDEEDDDDFESQDNQFEYEQEDFASFRSKKNSPFHYSQDEDRKYGPKYDVSSMRSSASRSTQPLHYAPSSIERFPRTNEVAELKMSVKAVAKGIGAELSAEVSFKRDLNSLIDALHTKLVFVNVPFSSLQKLEVCTTATVRYPEVPCDFHSRMNPDLVKPILADIKTSWGQQCSSTPQISIKVKLEKSIEQKELEAAKDSWYYIQCQEDLRKKMKLSDACDLVQDEISSLNKFVVDLDYNNRELPSWLKNATYKVDTFFKVHNYAQMTNNPVDVQNPPNKLRIVGFLYDDVQAYDLQIYKPHENTFFKKVPFDEDVFYLFPFSTDKTMVEQFVDEVTDGYYEPSCEVMGNYINTFDNNTFKAPLSQCHHVLAKDCSRDDLFAVTMAKPDPSQDAKELKVFVLTHLIHVVPKGLYNGQFHVEIDSKIVEVSDEQVVALKTQDPDARDMIVALVVSTGPILHIQLPFTGVLIKFDGSEAEIIVSQFWRGQVCGACGEFREETDEDLVGPKQCLYPDPYSFLLSYGLQDYGCQLPTSSNTNKICGDDYYSKSAKQPYLGQEFQSRKSKGQRVYDDDYTY